SDVKSSRIRKKGRGGRPNRTRRMGVAWERGLRGKARRSIGGQRAPAVSVPSGRGTTSRDIALAQRYTDPFQHSAVRRVSGGRVAELLERFAVEGLCFRGPSRRRKQIGQRSACQGQ